MIKMRELRTALLLAVATIFLLLQEAAAQTFSCTFEIDFCGMEQSQEEPTLYDWIRLQGRTPTSIGQNVPLTGPETAYRGTYYTYIETSDPRRSGEYAILLTPSLNIIGPACVKFAVNMNGAHVGSLEVVRREQDNTIQTLRTITGDQGRNWFTLELTAQMRNQLDKIGFIGTRGVDYLGDIAIDEVSVSRGVCSGGGGVFPATPPPPFNPFPTPAPPTPFPPGPVPGARTLPYRCDFEQTDLCGMENVNSRDFNGNFLDVFDWTRNTGSTPTSLTGPNQAYRGIWYMHIEASSPRTRGDRAILLTPPLGYQGDVCVEFQYHMRGRDTGALYVYSSQRGLNNPLDRIIGEQGDQWLQRQLDVFLSFNDRIGFIGEVGPDIRGDIAIDSLEIRPGRCQGNLTNPIGLPYSCSFEVDFCGMSQRQDDQFDWLRRNEPTETADTGPPGAAAGTWYAYAEGSSPTNPRDRAILQTPNLMHDGEVCIHFSYSMYGVDVDSLLVSINNDRMIFQKRGNQGNRWFEENISVLLTRGDVVQFTAIRGPSYRSDIGLDDLRITPGNCRGSSPVPTVTPPGGGLRDFFSCDVESNARQNSFCRLRQCTNDQFDWTRQSGRTPTGARFDRRLDFNQVPVTGPDGARQGQYYLFIEASGKLPQSFACLVVEGQVVQNRGPSCLRFYYCMNGFHTGRLAIQQDKGQGLQDVWSLHGDQKEGWKRAAVDMDLTNSREVRVFADVNGEFSGDISIDDLQITQGQCEATPQPYLWQCNFETRDGSATLCDMIQDKQLDTPNFDWSLKRDATPSEFTGPGAAYNGQYYVYIEASRPRNPGDHAKILIPRLSFNGAVCVEVWIHMYGFHTGALEVFTRQGNVDIQRFMITGEQGNRWFQRRFTIDNYRSDEWIGFRGIRGGEYSGDIGLDNIQVRPNRC